jgi:molybdopterin converting factor small subunit
MLSSLKAATFHPPCLSGVERSSQTMRVEFFGVSRQRAGISQLEIEAETLGQVLEALAHRIPSLREFIEVDRLHPSLTASLNGDSFVSDPQTRLSKNDCVFILSADAGG